MGQIATFIENLHLDYSEVVYKIPYVNLLIMQKDKLHEMINNDTEEVEYKGARENPKFKKLIK